MKPGTEEYIRFHSQIRKVRGDANGRYCIDCFKQAMDWSWIHGTDPKCVDNYEPRCRSCHLRYDYTDERRDKKRKYMQGNAYTLGRVRPEEERAKLRGNTNASGKRTDEQCRRMSEGQKNSGTINLRRRTKPEVEAEVMRLWDNGLLLHREVADVIGIDRHTVGRIIKRNIP